MWVEYIKCFQHSIEMPAAVLGNFSITDLLKHWLHWNVGQGNLHYDASNQPVLTLSTNFCKDFNLLLLTHIVVISVGLLHFLWNWNTESHGKFNPDQTRIKGFYFFCVYHEHCMKVRFWFLNYGHKINFSSFILDSVHNILSIWDMETIYWLKHMIQ